MDKIVIITNQPEPDRGLLVLLNLGFREVVILDQTNLT